jgi:transposase
MSRVEVVTRVERRRRWTEAEKAAVLSETDLPGTNVAAVAQKHGISRSLIYNWRSARQAEAVAAMPGTGPVNFIPIGIVGEAQTVAPPQPAVASSSGVAASIDHGGMIEIELANGARLRVDGEVNERALGRVLRALKSVA